MIGRLRDRFGSPASGTGGIPSASEAIAAWALGTAWALCCLWLWRIGPGELVPVALLGALLTLWGWRSVRWLHWFPPVAIVASLLDLAAPMPADAAPGGLGYVGMIAFAAVLLALARLLAVGRLPIAGRPHEVSAVLLGALGTGLALATAGSSARACAAGLVAFGAALAMAARPTGERRVWVAFPMTAALIGAHALIAAHRGVLLEHALAADVEWGVPHALAQLLLLTLPVTVGLAIDAGPTLRLFSRIALPIGVAGLLLHLNVDRGLLPAASLATFVHAPSALYIAAGTLVFLGVVVGWLGSRGGAARPRWLGLAASLAVAAILLVWGRLLVAETAQVLLAFGVALASAVRTAERRARVMGLARADWPLAARFPARPGGAAAPDDAGASTTRAATPSRLEAPSRADTSPAPLGGAAEPVDDPDAEPVGRAA